MFNFGLPRRINVNFWGPNFSMDNVEEAALLGVALLQVQRLEFALYGVASHLTHLEPVRKHKKLKNLTGESFLRGSLSELNMTFGQLNKAVSEQILICTDELSAFVRKRNILVHDYWRLVKSNIKGAKKLDDPERFLREFVDDCKYWDAVFQGLVFTLMRISAAKDQRLDELNFDEAKFKCIEAYEIHAAKVINKENQSDA